MQYVQYVNSHIQQQCNVWSCSGDSCDSCDRWVCPLSGVPTLPLPSLSLPSVCSSPPLPHSKVALCHVITECFVNRFRTGWLYRQMNWCFWLLEQGWCQQNTSLSHRFLDHVSTLDFWIVFSIPSWWCYWVWGVYLGLLWGFSPASLNQSW